MEFGEISEIYARWVGTNIPEASQTTFVLQIGHVGLSIHFLDTLELLDTRTGNFVEKYQIKSGERFGEFNRLIRVIK